MKTLIIILGDPHNSESGAFCPACGSFNCEDGEGYNQEDYTDPVSSQFCDACNKTFLYCFPNNAHFKHIDEFCCEAVTRKKAKSVFPSLDLESAERTWERNKGDRIAYWVVHTLQPTAVGPRVFESDGDNDDIDADANSDDGDDEDANADAKDASDKSQDNTNSDSENDTNNNFRPP